MQARTKRLLRPRAQQMSAEALEMAAAAFRAPGAPLGLRLIQELEAGEQSVSALAERIESTQPNVSKHLKILQEAGLLNRRQQGTNAYYAIADTMVFELCEMICARLRESLEAQAGA